MHSRVHRLGQGVTSENVKKHAIQPLTHEDQWPQYSVCIAIYWEVHFTSYCVDCDVREPIKYYLVDFSVKGGGQYLKGSPLLLSRLISLLMFKLLIMLKHPCLEMFYSKSLRKIVIQWTTRQVLHFLWNMTGEQKYAKYVGGANWTSHRIKDLNSPCKWTAFGLLSVGVTE